MSGKLIQQEIISMENSGNKIKLLDISSLSSGVYLCSIQCENKISTLKFIKE